MFYCRKIDRGTLSFNQFYDENDDNDNKWNDIKLKVVAVLVKMVDSDNKDGCENDGDANSKDSVSGNHTFSCFERGKIR